MVMANETASRSAGVRHRARTPRRRSFSRLRHRSADVHHPRARRHSWPGHAQHAFPSRSFAESASTRFAISVATATARRSTNPMGCAGIPRRHHRAELRPAHHARERESSVRGPVAHGRLPNKRLPLLIALITAGLPPSPRAAPPPAGAARLRTEFVSGVSHELRTPLAQIRWFAEPA